MRSSVCSWKTKTTDILTPSLHRRCSVIQKRGRHQPNTTQTPEDLAPDPQAQARPSTYLTTITCFTCPLYTPDAPCLT